MVQDNSEFERAWLGLKRNIGYYYSRILNYPFCPPEHVYFSLTNRCNLRCKMCSVPNTPSRAEDELSIEECKTIISQIAHLNIDHLIFSGGEPLLRTDIYDLISHAVDKKIKMVDIITNGILIDSEVAKKLIASGLNHITISIDGLEQTDDFVRGKGAFHKAIEAIDSINKYKDNNMPTVGINFTIMDCNIGQILPMVDLARSKGCNIIVLQPMLSDNTDMQERKKNELWVSEGNIHKLEGILKELLELKRTYQDFSIHVNEKILEMIPAYFAGLPLDKRLKCYEGIVRIVISHNGDLWTCLRTYGNLRKMSLKDCWFSAQAKEIRQEVKQCKNHCLQSCIHLVELSDIYSEVIKFKDLITKDKRDKKYLNNLMLLFQRYKTLLKRRKQIQYLRNIFVQNRNDNLKELNFEISQISMITKDIT